MPDPLPITVTAGSDRLSQREQIEQVLERARAKGEPVRIRLPLTLYDHTDARSYAFLRDAAWNLSLPSKDATPETIEALIHTLGVCIVAVAQHGSARIEGVLRALDVADAAADVAEGAQA